MIDALTATTSGMVNDMARLNTISHNLANSATSGFKKEILVNRNFIEYLGMGNTDASAQMLPVGLPQTETVTDHKAGTLKFSGNPLDIAIEGNGYFEVMTEQGPAYTRQGNFKLDAQGRLVTESGLPVVGASGELMLTTPQPAINSDGKILQGDREIGRLKVVKFDNEGMLQSIGHGLYLAGPKSQMNIDDTAHIRQGYTEMSNVNSMTEMVKLIETMRHFESSQRVIQGYNDMMDKALHTLGEF